MPALFGIDWRLIFVATAAFFVFPLGLLILWGQDIGRGSANKWSDYRPLFSNEIILGLGFLHAAHFGGVMTLCTWFTGFAIHLDPGRGLGVVAILGALVMLVSGSARLAGGLFLKVLSPYKIIVGSCIILLICFSILSQVKDSGVALLVFSVAIFFSSVTFGPIFFLSFVATGLELAATGFGIVNFIANVGSLLLPIAFGFFIDVSGPYALPFSIHGRHPVRWDTRNIFIAKDACQSNLSLGRHMTTWICPDRRVISKYDSTGFRFMSASKAGGN